MNVLLKKFCKSLLTIAVAAWLLIGSSGWMPSSTAWAAGSDEIAKLSTMVGKSTEGGITNMTGNSKAKAAVKAEKFEAKTQEALKNSIQNPSYTPGGNDKELEMKDRKSAREMKSEAQSAFK